MPQLIDGQCVESIAKQMGLEFRRETNEAKYHAHLRKCKGVLDPDVVYLFDPGVPIHPGSDSIDPSVGTCDRCCDAVLSYHDTQVLLHYNQHGKVYIQKVLRSAMDPECDVCYEEWPVVSHVCARCGSKLCPFCKMKVCLTPENIDLLLSGLHGTRVSASCVQCRLVCMINLDLSAYLVSDRLRDFDDRQREALLFLMDSDPSLGTTWKSWKENQSLNKNRTVKRFKEGCRVRTHGLKSERKWNGRIGTIIGEKVIKNDVIRWPVQLSGKSAKTRSKMLLKGVNM